MKGQYEERAGDLKMRLSRNKKYSHWTWKKKKKHLIELVEQQIRHTERWNGQMRWSNIYLTGEIRGKREEQYSKRKMAKEFSRLEKYEFKNHNKS